MSDSLNISIISACRNEVRHIGEFLDSIGQQNLDGYTWEVIVADGMSTDGTREFLEYYSKNRPQFRVIGNPGKIVSTGLNAAIRAAKGEIIIRMDAHTMYAADYSARCIETLEKTGADNVGGPARTKVTGVIPRAVAAAYHSRFSTGGARFHQDNFEGYVDTVTYGCWKKTTLERLGLFDETLVRNQDDEMNLRIVRGGGKVYQNPAIVSWYSPRPSISALFKQYFQYGFWKVKVIQKHGRPGSWRHLVPATFVAVVGGLFLIGLVALLAGFKLPALLWLTLVGIYALANLAASAVAAKQEGWDTMPYLPLVFGAYHFSYGSGFLLGLLQFGNRQEKQVPVESVFTKLSR